MAEKDKKELTAKEKRDKIIRVTAKVIVIILIIHLFMILTKCTKTEVKYVDESVPSDEVEIERIPYEVCNEVEYQWAYDWVDWFPSEGDIITGAFKIYNIEPRAGIYTVSFAFFDQSLYPYSDYEGKNYLEVADVLPWDAASMFVNNLSQVVKGEDTMLFTPSVKKKDPSHEYWIYADVSAPTYIKCETKYNISAKNTSVFLPRKVKKEEKIQKSLWQMFVEYMFR